MIFIVVVCCTLLVVLSSNSSYLYFCFQGGLSNDLDQLRTCKRCQRTFPVLSDLFNHLCDDENEQLKTTNNHSTSLLDQISSTSPKSFKLSRQPSSLQTNSTATSKDSQAGHIPLFKRPLFQHVNPPPPSYPSSSSSSIRIHS